ncbi:MAG: DNA internalization-related competence protein ComEC/Rec2 [Bacillota bacterium]
MKITRRPAFMMVIALAAGIFSSYFMISYDYIFPLKIMIIMEFFYLLFYLFYDFNSSKKSIFILLIIFFLILGSVLYAYQEYKYQSEFSIINFSNSGSSRVLAQVVFDIGDLESNKVYLKPFFIDDHQVKYGKILITSEELKKFNDGDLIALELELAHPAAALNPGSFNYSEYLKNKGVYLQGWNLKKSTLIKNKNSIKNIIIIIKKALLNNINSLFNKDNAAFIKSILLGEKEYLSYEQEFLLRRAGASHLLAISGLHMGIIILCFSFVLFKVCSKKRNALYLLSFFTLNYIILVGAAVSIIRAALLALLFLFSSEFNREGDFLNIISITLIINLILDPLALFTVSLQLSYILVLSLYYLTPLLSSFVSPILAVSMSAQLASLAITAYYFNEYAYIALITNLWLIPYITIVLPFIFILVLLSIFSLSFVQPLALIIEIGLDFLFKGLELMTLIQKEPLVIAKPELVSIILYYLLLFSLPYVYQKRYIYIKAKNYQLWQKIIPVFLAIIIISFFINPASKELEVNFIAVGQGDGIFIKFPNGENMLIDTGPPGSDGRNIEYSIISFLNNQGISSLDYFMISHFDADHAGGMPHLLKRKEIKNILIPPFKEKTELHNILEKEIKKRKIKVKFLSSGMSFDIADCRIDILNPDYNNLNEDRNENSIVFLLTHKENTFLFTGDLSKNGENRIINKYDLAEVDVLKAGHHGSKTSSGEIFLNKIRPKIIVISVGRNNFGHPSAEVIERYNKKSIKYLRTDKSGMIKFISDGNEIFLNTFR